jgi:hypothetical protein
MAAFLSMLADDMGRGVACWLDDSYKFDSTHKLQHAWVRVLLLVVSCVDHNRFAVSLVKAVCVHIDVYPDTTRLLRRCCRTDWTGPTWGRQISALWPVDPGRHQMQELQLPVGDILVLTTGARAVAEGIFDCP